MFLLVFLTEKLDYQTYDAVGLGNKACELNVIPLKLLIYKGNYFENMFELIERIRGGLFNVKRISRVSSM